MRRSPTCLVTLFLLASCATTSDPGWNGTGAEPFDGARDSCREQSQGAVGTAEEAATFEACMRAHGWSKGG